jgi:hypothetical protein
MTLRLMMIQAISHAVRGRIKLLVMVGPSVGEPIVSRGVRRIGVTRVPRRVRQSITPVAMCMAVPATPTAVTAPAIHRNDHRERVPPPQPPAPQPP